MWRCPACCRTRSASAAPTHRSCSSGSMRDIGSSGAFFGALRAKEAAGAFHMLMKGKRGLVMGVANDHSIAWGIARALAAHGASLAFTYQGEALGRRVRPLAESIGASLVLPCDVEHVRSLDATFAVIGEKWGSLDFLVHAIA